MLTDSHFTFAVVQYEDRGLATAERHSEHSGPAFKPGFAGRTSGFSKWPKHMACPVQAPQRRIVSACFFPPKLLYHACIVHACSCAPFPKDLEKCVQGC